MANWEVTLRNEASGWAIGTYRLAAETGEAAVAAAKKTVPYGEQISFRASVRALASEAEDGEAIAVEDLRSAEEEIASRLPQSVIDFIRNSEGHGSGQGQ